MKKPDRPARKTPRDGAAKPRATIRDVAAAAGVSAMTVSNVINGRTQFVREGTRRKVLRSIEDLNYRPASSGRNLRLGRRHAIGVVIVDEAPDFLSSPFIARFVSGLCAALNDSGYVMIVQGIHPDEFESAFPLRRAEADAYCIRLNGAASARERMLTALERLEEPVILIQETLPLPGADRCVVRQDDFGGARLIADHLIARGIRSVSAIAPRYVGPMTNARLAGLQAGFMAAPQPIQMAVLSTETNNFAGGRSAVSAALDRGPIPSAFVGVNDELALAAMRAVQDRGLNVPKDVMIVGFNGFQPAAYTLPTLTTIESRASEIGAMSGRILIDRLAGKAFAASEHVLPVSFRKGQSTT